MMPDKLSIQLPNTAVPASGQSAKTKEKAADIEKAATQFEALLIGELLKSARGQDGEGWMGTDSDDAGAVLTDMSEQMLTSALASSGGLGLAKMVTAGLKQAEHKPSDSQQGG
jgi:Rod binding domain-containing protein